MVYKQIQDKCKFQKRVFLKLSLELLWNPHPQLDMILYMLKIIRPFVV